MENLGVKGVAGSGVGVLLQVLLHGDDRDVLELARRIIGDRRDWTFNLLRAARLGRVDDARFWERLHVLLTATDLHPMDLGPMLRGMLDAADPHADAARAPIYAILLYCGEMVGLDEVRNDHRLRISAPLRWLDLMLSETNDPYDRQELILGIVRSGAMRPTDVGSRKDLLVGSSNGNPRSWMTTIRNAFPYAFRAEAQFHLSDAFGMAFEGRRRPVETEKVVLGLPGDRRHAQYEGHTEAGAGRGLGA